MNAGEVARAEVDHAGMLTEEALAPFFPALAAGELRRLGGEVFVDTRRRVRAKGLAPDLAGDVFQDFLVDALERLHRHGAYGAPDVRRWVQALAQRAFWRHLRHLFGVQDRSHPLVLYLEQLLSGEIEYSLPGRDLVVEADEDLERLVLTAIARLEGRHRELAERHFLRQQSKEQIKDAMHLPSDRSLARLFRQTLKLLIVILKELIAHLIAASWVA